MKKTILSFTIAIILMDIELIILTNDIFILKESNEQLEENISTKTELSTLKETKENLNTEVQSLLAASAFNEEDIEKIVNVEEDIPKGLEKDIATLENTVIDLEDKLTALQEEYNQLVKENVERNSFYITDVPFINQYPNYPTGCEVVALTILLKYYGVSVTPDDIIDKLPKGITPITKNGKIYGGNPEVEYIGNPYSSYAYGVYEKPIALVANQYKSGIKIATGTSFEEILKIVTTGTPVMVWTSMYLATPYVSQTWIYEPTGETIYWKANEHSVIIIGYTEDKVIISDSIGGQIKYQSKNIFKERYEYFGRKALYY